MSIRLRQWAQTITIAACALGLVFVIVPAVFDRDVGLWAKLLLLACGLVAAWATFRGSGGLQTPRHWSGFFQPRFATALLLAAVPAFSLIIDVRSVLEPPPARESAPFALEKGQDAIAANLDLLRSDIRSDQEDADATGIERRISRLWGEPGCDVVWRVALAGNALTAEAVRRPPGARPWTFVGTITGRSRNALEVRGESPPSARGHAATFSYETNGVTEALTWDDRVRGAPLVLGPCS